MHEGQFTEKIVDAILDELKKHPGAKIKTIKVKVGEVYHLILESVLMHFEMITKGTTLEGVELELQQEAMQVSCRQCGLTAPVEDHHMLMCSSCNSMNVVATSGNTITVESIQFEN